ncbi:MAG: thiamine pyrophosphate-dependent dehydrogenase E1 component subunit alpha [Actinobacteria bacterium]|nr:thiamine pyrophosphate-dependent dehydrogenase E1 component subunit alpha [Actinomycetota bacterium]
MVKIRSFEERIRFLFLEGKMPGTIHQYIGMEANAVGVCSALQKDDVIASTHRPHGHAIARGLSFNEIMAELYGRTTGCCRGKGGSMHLGNLEKGMLTAIAIVGGNLPIVVGMSLAFKLMKQNRVAVSFFGDGASNEGSFHESLNMAAVLNTPSVFVCENNQYGASTSIKKVMKIENIADRARSYGIEGVIADGMDVIDVYIHAKDAIEKARKGGGPTLLELKTFRFCGHSRRDPGSYIPKEEKESWQRKDPINNFKKLLLNEGLAGEDELDDINNLIEKELDESIIFAQESPEPAPEDTLKDLYATMEVPE